MLNLFFEAFADYFKNKNGLLDLKKPLEYLFGCFLSITQRIISNKRSFQ